MVTIANIEKGNTRALVSIRILEGEPRPQTDEVPDGLHERQLVQECKWSEQYDGLGSGEKCRLQLEYGRCAQGWEFYLLAGSTKERQGESNSQQNFLLIRRQVHEHTLTFVVIV